MAGPATDPVVRVRAVLDAWQSGEPLTDHVAPDFRAVGQPFPFVTVPDSNVDESREQLQSRMRVTFRNLVAGPGGRVMFECIWEHTVSGRGSAGLAWGVFELRDGLVAQAWWLQSEPEALRTAGLADDRAQPPALEGG